MAGDGLLSRHPHGVVFPPLAADPSPAGACRKTAEAGPMAPVLMNAGWVCVSGGDLSTAASLCVFNTAVFR
jgi:hypothetical protein